MSHIRQIDYETAAEDSRAAFEHEVRERGHATNMKRTLMHSPVAYHAYMQWYPLWDEIKALVGLRAAVVFAHSISSTNQCLLCTVFFRRAIAQLGESPDSFVLAASEQTLAAFGRALARHYEPVPDALWSELKHRYGERELVNLVAFAGLMVATNLFNNSVGVEVDGELHRYLPEPPVDRRASP